MVYNDPNITAWLAESLETISADAAWECGIVAGSCSVAFCKDVKRRPFSAGVNQTSCPVRGWNTFCFTSVMSSKISTPNAYQSAVVVKPSLLKTSWEKKRHDIISRYTNNKIFRYQFQDILNIVMNATAMVKGQGCQESGAKYSVLLPEVAQALSLACAFLARSLPSLAAHVSVLLVFRWTKP